MPILAVKTAHITARGRQREALTAWQEVEDRFFFYRVNSYSYRFAIDKTVELAIDVLPCGAVAAFSFSDNAFSRAYPLIALLYPQKAAIRAKQESSIL